MYCGCNEKALSSQRAIACALLELLKCRSYADIPVSLLCRTAGVSRPTFYSLFGSKDDVIAYLLRESYSYVPEAEESCGSELESLCLGYSRYFTAQRPFLRLLVDNAVSYLLYESICESLLCCGCFLPGLEEGRRRAAASFTAGGLTGVVQDYVVRADCSPEELEQLLRGLLGGALFG